MTENPLLSRPADTPFHGGDLATAERLFGRPEAGWIDLSTGINPHAYPHGGIADTAWQRLPSGDAEQALLDAARRYYRVPDFAGICAVPGTQAAIQHLPGLLPSGQVDILSPTYAEHAHCWSRDRQGGTLPARDRQNGSDADAIDPVSLSKEVQDAPASRVVREIDRPSKIDENTKIAIIVNPNNPDGKYYNVKTLLELAATLAGRGGWLVIDEAFADAGPGMSCLPDLPADGMVVLRSFGKFFGLAGLRLGFVIGPPELCNALQARLGPWAVSGPALEIGAKALADTAWQETTRERLARDSDKLRTLLANSGLEIVGGTGLFCLTHTADSEALYRHLCAAGILCRFFPDRPGLLRFGLPGPEADWQRLEKALSGGAAGARGQITD